VTAEPTGFLYPFIEHEEHDAAGLIDDLASSAKAKLEQSAAMRAATLDRYAGEVQRAAEAMADRFARGGRLLAFGNGGSATDAEGAVALFRDPPAAARPLPAMSLVEDPGVLTALANDIGFDVVFSRQVIAHGRGEDIALGFSTSGDSVNVLRALVEARGRGLLTLGLCGYSGGAMAASADLAHCLVVQSDSVHRIQETQSALMLALWSGVQRRLSEGGPS
jgi:D-sedoheptulose 7-phosphate isomerase